MKPLRASHHWEPCPHCQRPMLVGETSTLSPETLQEKLLKFVERHPSGVGMARIVQHLYADKADGGPLYAAKCVHTMVCRLNHDLLSKQGLRLRATGGPASVYRLEAI